MRKSLLAFAVSGVLLVGAAPAMAQGVGDPLGLAASGVLVPYLTEAGTVATIEIASPVAEHDDSADLHILFYNNTCARLQSLPIELTANHVNFVASVADIVGDNVNGLAAIASTVDGLNLIPIPSSTPIHVRTYLYSPVDGRSRVLEPITLDHAEFPGDPHTWNPMRTGATFFAPQQTTSVNTVLMLICPRTTIQGATGSAFSDEGFPVISPSFSSSTTALAARIYDTDENFLRNAIMTCDCLTNTSVLTLSNVYGRPEAANGTFTELVTGTGTGTFTGYRAVFTVGSPLNNFFGRLSNASKGSLAGTLTPSR